MELEHSFEIPEGIERAWEVLNDIQTIAQCMPGASVDTVVGDDVTGTCKVKLGPVALTYKGKATFTARDREEHRIVLVGQAQDGSNGRAALTVTAQLEPAGQDTRVTIHTDLKVTGKPAQFGRGVMSDVGDRMIGQFAANLQTQLALERAESGHGEAANGGPTRLIAPNAATHDGLNLLAVAGPAIATRALRLLLITVVLSVIAWLLSRRK